MCIRDRRIADEYFIGLLWKFLKAGYMEDWNYHNTYSGTPQGSIISPILANIYMNELDSYMAEYAEKSVSYTHLDVYKRQGLQRDRQPLPQRQAPDRPHQSEP